MENPAADAEIAAVAATFFGRVGLTASDVRIQFNNRRLMDSEIAALGLTDQKAAVFRLIDRRGKMSQDAWGKYSGELGLAPAQTEKLEGLLNERDLWKKSDECVDFVKAVQALGVGEYMEYDPTVIRGLDYYTGTVYEARDREGEFRAILGGGRYDNLVGDVGGERLPGVGFAMGDMVVGLVAQKYGRVPEFKTSPSDVLVTVFDSASLTDSLVLAGELRSAGLQIEWYPEAVRLDRQLKYADTARIRFAVIVGPDEAAKGVVTVKDLQTRTQEVVVRGQLATDLRKKLG
jgi:histidyl-tRNA synthetase